MKRFRLIYIVTFLVAIVSAERSYGQFDVGRNTSTLESKVDTLKVKVKETSEMLNFKIYNDAYDKYLREMQRKHRNFYQMKSGLTFTQTSFSNWSAGGANSYASRGALNMEHKYTAPKFNVQTIFDGAIGIVSSDGVVRKNEDQFSITSKPSWKISNHFEFTASLVLRSQFSNTFVRLKNTDGSEYAQLTSTVLAPAYLTAAPGIKYMNKSKTIEVFVSPSGGNMIMVLNRELANRGRFGEAGRQFIPQFVNYVSFVYREKIFNKKLGFDCKFESIWNYNHPTPRLISENKIGYQLTKILSANAFVQAIFDDTMKTPNPGNHLQITETIGFGIGYNFASKKHPAPSEEPRKNYKRNKIR